eukprot:2851964-Rhodomonas_salina.3
MVAKLPFVMATLTFAGATLGLTCLKACWSCWAMLGASSWRKMRTRALLIQLLIVSAGVAGHRATAEALQPAVSLATETLLLCLTVVFGGFFLLSCLARAATDSAPRWQRSNAAGRASSRGRQRTAATAQREAWSELRYPPTRCPVLHGAELCHVPMRVLCGARYRLSDC